MSTRLTSASCETVAAFATRRVALLFHHMAEASNPLRDAANWIEENLLSRRAQPTDPAPEKSTEVGDSSLREWVDELITSRAAAGEALRVHVHEAGPGDAGCSILVSAGSEQLPERRFPGVSARDAQKAIGPRFGVPVVLNTGVATIREKKETVEERMKRQQAEKREAAKKEGALYKGAFHASS